MSYLYILTFSDEMNLHNRYRQNTLRGDELRRLRQELETLDDDTLATQLEEEWLTDSPSEASISEEQLSRLKGRIDSQLGRSTMLVRPASSSAWWQRTMRYAAVVMLPLLAATSLYLYLNPRSQGHSPVLVQTERHQQAGISLPDGSRIRLNENSRVAYTADYTKSDERRVDFDGEAYFEVVKDPEHPMVIEQRGLRIQVLGTSFNLRAYKSENLTTLSLSEGSVQMDWQDGQQSRMIRPGERAVYDHERAQLSVEPIQNMRAVSAWTRHELSFEAIPLSEVIRALEQSYDVRLKARAGAADTIAFTGTLPSDNLDEALRTLSRSLGIELEKM